MNLKRNQTGEGNFFLLPALDEMARKERVSITDSKAKDRLIEIVRSCLDESLDHAARVHGFHSQSMFPHIASALGQCEIIVEEDSGVFFSNSVEMRRPDFRIVTRSAGQMLVEVKNHHSKDPFGPLIVKPEYLKSMKSYANLMAIPLKFAVYWAHWNVWTLLNADLFDPSGRKIEIQFADAIKSNEMYLLGDSMLGTIPPLSIRVYPQLSTVEWHGNEVGFRIEKACVCSGGVELNDKKDAALALFLILNGDWTQYETVATYDDSGAIQYVDNQVSPSELVERGDFYPMRTHGYQSSMLSREYQRATTHNGVVTNLVPLSQPDEFGVSIPDEFQGRSLKLWQLTVLPQHIDKEKYFAKNFSNE